MIQVAIRARLFDGLSRRGQIKGIITIQKEVKVKNEQPKPSAIRSTELKFWRTFPQRGHKRNLERDVGSGTNSD